MGCKLSIHVANPHEGDDEALHKEVAALRETVAELQKVLQQQQTQQQQPQPPPTLETTSKGDKPPLKPTRSKRFTTEQEQLMVERTPSFVSNISISDHGDMKAMVVKHQDKHNEGAASTPVVMTTTMDMTGGDLSGEFTLRVPLKPTQVVTQLLQACHAAETNALEHLITLSSSTTDHGQAAEAWRAYRAFRTRYDCLLHGETSESNNEQQQQQQQEGGLLHFLGLPADLDDQQGEVPDIRAIEESLDWRDDAQQALARYRNARLVHMERVEDEILPRLEALQAAAAEEDKDPQQDGEEEDMNLDEMTKSVLYTHVLNPFAADETALESFVRYVTRALERKGINKSAIRPFQNALKAMASSAEQADLYKSWITHTRRTGILTEKAKEKAAAAAAASTEPTATTKVSTEQTPEQPVLVKDKVALDKAEEPIPEQAPATKESSVNVQEQAPVQVAT